MLGIWTRESGRAYPNPYSNGLGYGGEFGTRITAAWGSSSQQRYTPEPPVEQQANTMAQILAQNIASHHGDIANALLAYSGGSYSSVPGQSTFGTWVGAKPNGTGHGDSLTSPGDWWYAITHPTQDVGAALTLGGKSTANAVGSAVGGIFGGAFDKIGKDILYGVVLMVATMVFMSGLILVGADLGLGMFASRNPVLGAAKKTAGATQRTANSIKYRGGSYKQSRRSKSDAGPRIKKVDTGIGRPLRKQKQDKEEIPF